MYQYRIRCSIYLLENPSCFYISSALCDTSVPPTWIFSGGHYRHIPSHKVPFRLVLSLDLNALTIDHPGPSKCLFSIFWKSLPNLVISYIMLYHISKIHSSSSSTTFACDARQSRKENHVKLEFSHATELCCVAKGDSDQANQTAAIVLPFIPSCHKRLF